jgi:hypothetical protein
VESSNGAERFLGVFDRETAMLTVPVEAGRYVRLSFRLYLLLSWDGNLRHGIGGPDVWRVGVGGLGVLLNTTFDNCSSPPCPATFSQAYPGAYPGSDYPGGTGAVDEDFLGYMWEGVPMDSRYDLEFIVKAPSDSLVVSFTSLQSQPWPDEGWGLDNVKVEMLPGGVPGQPVDVTAVSTGTGALVSFSPPDSDGDHPITNYRIRCTSSTGGATRRALSAGSPVLVNGLTGSATYACQVRASNELGAGPFSSASPSFETPVGLPSAPRDVRVTSAGAMRSVSVRFSPPASDGGSRITFYKVLCTSSTGGVNRSGAATASPVTVANLMRGTSYFCRARAVNVFGTGPQSAPSASFTRRLPA